MIIKVNNLLDVNAPYTFLSVSKASGVGTINVKNASQFSASWAVQIGKTGEEKSEIKVLGTATPSGTSLVLSANTGFDHPADTPVYAIKYDQVVFAKSASGTAGTATPITGGTINIAPDSSFTFFDDTTGLSTDAYRAYYLNSVTSATTSFSDWITPEGFSFYSLAKIRDRIKKKLFSAKFLQDDEQVNDWINEWLEEMNNAAVNVDKSYSLGTANVSFGTDGLGTITSNDFKGLKRIWITYDGVNDYRATNYDISDVYPNETYSITHPYYSWRDDNVFEAFPHDTAGTAKLVYYKIKPVLVNDADELPVSMRSYSKSFVNYALSEAYYFDDKDQMGDRFFGKAKSDKELFIREITPRNFTDVQMMEIDTFVSPDGEEVFYL